MKSIRDIALLAGASALALLASCTKEASPSSAEGEETGEEIVIGMDDDGLDIDTKVAAVTAISGTWYWGATTGTTTEAAKWSSTAATPSSNKISTGKYQTATATAYNYYVSNNALTVGANTTVSAANTKDVIVGRTAASTSTSPSVTLDHVFARTGTVTVRTASGSGTLASITVKLTSPSGSTTGTAGTYNLRTAAWSSVTALAATTLGGTWSPTTAAASATLTPTVGTHDLYLIPGTYTVSVTATYTRGDYTTGSVTKTGSVTLVGGKVNNMTITWPEAGTAITINLSLTAWGTQAVTATVS